MKKYLFMFLAVVIVAGLTLSGCAKPAPTPAPAPDTTPAQEPVTSPGEPQYGGVLRIVRDTFPVVLGYPPEMGPRDRGITNPAQEQLMTWDSDGNYVPQVAKSVEVDTENRTITFHLREGVKFHDGTPLNAEACRWNFEILIDAGMLSNADNIEFMEVVDEYTFRIYAKKYHNQLLNYWAWGVRMFSPTAIEEKGIEWARQNVVGTGPFKLARYERDSILRFERFDDYWREGYPYLDAIESYYVPDSMTATAMMEAGEADVWPSISEIEQILYLEEKGFKVNWGPGLMWVLLPDSNNPNSPFADKRVCEAVEYALNRSHIAEMIGRGCYEPLHQMAHSNSPAYVPGYNPRPYNPDKAKQLLAEAGYPQGFETAILAQAPYRDAVVAIQSYLEAVGIKVKLDLADMARYNAAAFQDGWSGLLFGSSGINPDASDLIVHYGSTPMTFRSGSFKQSPEFLALLEEALITPNYPDRSKYLEILGQAIRRAGDDAMVTPVYRSATATVMQDYVHSEHNLVHGIQWDTYLDWIEKH